MAFACYYVRVGRSIRAGLLLTAAVIAVLGCGSASYAGGQVVRVLVVKATWGPQPAATARDMAAEPFLGVSAEEVKQSFALELREALSGL